MKQTFLSIFLGLCISLSAQAANPVVEMKTNLGSITLELYADKAPKTVANFLYYVKTGYYQGVIFHRVIDGFMIQGGGYDANLVEKTPAAPIQNEANNGLKNEPYTVAMARTSNPHSATAQFFINVANNDALNHSAPTAYGWGYAVFGKVIKGQDVVMKIAKLRTGPKGSFPAEVPVQTVMIEDIKLLP